MNAAVPSKHRPWSGCGFSAVARGFTLIELLAVVAIIAILMTMGMVGVKNLAAGKSTVAAVASAEALFEEARLTAVSKATTARVLVDVSDPSDKDRENYLRRLAVAYRYVDETGNATDTWILANRGYIMPQGVYFSRELSKTDHANGGSKFDKTAMDLYAVGRDPAQAPQKLGTNWSGREYIVYEFNSEGICTTPGASFIVGAGARPANAEQPRVTGAAKRDFGGFVVWRNGRVSLFRSTEQADIPVSTEKF